MADFEEAKIYESPGLGGGPAMHELKPFLTVDLLEAWNRRIRIQTGNATIDLLITNGKLGKVTQTEAIRK